MTPLRKLVVQLNASGVVVFRWRTKGHKTRVRIVKEAKIRRSEWGKIVKRLKALGFKYVTWNMGWYCDYRKGKWIRFK